MRRGNHSLLIVTSVLVSWLILAFDGYATELLAEKLDALLDQYKLAPKTYGLEIKSLRDGRVLFARNADLALNPASGMKVLTTSSALSMLGPNFRFVTTVAQAEKNLCLIGGGDPSMVSETLWLLVQQVRRARIQKIEGDLIIDSTKFGFSRDHLESFEGDSDRAFTAPIDSLSLNFNSLTIHALPTKLGAAPIIQLEPEFEGVSVINRAKTAGSATKRDLVARIVEKGEKFVVEVSGKVSSSSSRTTIYRSVPNPELYAALLFVDHFKRAGGTFAGKIRMAPCPTPSVEVIQFKSKPLSQIVFDINKFSNNFMAEMVFRALGTKPTTEDGIAAVKKWLVTNEIDAPELVMENGSGLSRFSRISAHSMVSILTRVGNDVMLGPEFMASLGIAGVDGTLHRRMVKTRAEAKVRGKSGQLSQAISLAGYADSLGVGPVVFSFIFNPLTEQSASLQKLEDEMLQTIVAPNIK